MIDDDYDFGQRGGLQNQWGLFALLAALIVMGVFWWNDTINKNQEIDELVRKTRRLESKLQEAESARDSARSRYEAVKKSRPALQVNSLAAKPPASPEAKKPSSNSNPPEVASNKAAGFDVAGFLRKVKSANTPAELESIDHREPGIHEAITPLLQLTSDREFRINALVSLRMLDIPSDRQEDVQSAMVDLIDSNRFGDVDDCEEVNRHAYSLLVLLGGTSNDVQEKLAEIMDNDHSPWAGYACIAYGLLNREADISDRMVQLLASPFETNRLVVVRKFPDFVESTQARDELKRMYDHETSETIRQSIINSMNRLH